jgi:hypothetical protein
MLTIFTTAKPFEGHSAIIQRNALQSWKLLHPDVEIILFGDDDGAAEVACQLSIRHEPHVERNELGLKRIDYYFDRAQEIARHDLLCYVNCDIILTANFCPAVEQVRASHSHFLMVGRRWDTDVREPIDFLNPNWAEETLQRAIAENRQRDRWFIDYFAFSRGLYHHRIPPFVIGRIAWDNWLVWCALDLSTPVVDASQVIRAIHQNHDYGYHPHGRPGVWEDEQARRNLRLAGGANYLRSIWDATEILRPDGLRYNSKRHWVSVERIAVPAGQFVFYKIWLPIWHLSLGITRPVRTLLGLRSKSAGPRQKV